MTLCYGRLKCYLINYAMQYNDASLISYVMTLWLSKCYFINYAMKYNGASLI
jgi:hypothetical protein